MWPCVLMQNDNFWQDPEEYSERTLCCDWADRWIESGEKIRTFYTIMMISC